ncbi:APH(3') family aminoglycoside O-phosphotransferase [uncultured Sphingomonas sp.]|uniref:APH(3') family aminoglycoside O-phosphotransferase n=1 Tax=uncultured Sphingomonas sp. TaxID=158754 RepID=UPI0035CC110C
MNDNERECPVPPVTVPDGLAALVAGYDWGRDLVGESGSSVRRLHAPERPTLYLKHGANEIGPQIIDEFARLAWLAKHMPVPRIRRFIAAPADAWLLTDALPGRTAHQRLVDEPERGRLIVVAIIAFLKRLHAIPPDHCPFNAAHPLRLAHAHERMVAGEVDRDDFGDDHAGWSTERLWDHMTAFLPFEPDPVVTHGDWSLDNILLDGDRVAGCIDIDRAGIADRYQDLAILHDCLGEFDPSLRDEMWRAYGIARPDRRKIDFHLALDEFF